MNQLLQVQLDDYCPAECFCYGQQAIPSDLGIADFQKNIDCASEQDISHILNEVKGVLTGKLAVAYIISVHSGYSTTEC